MDLSCPDLTPLAALVTKGVAQLPGADNSFAAAMQSIALLAAAVSTPVAYHPWQYAGPCLLAAAGAAFTLWRVRQGEQAHGR